MEANSTMVSTVKRHPKELLPGKQDEKEFVRAHVEKTCACESHTPQGKLHPFFPGNASQSLAVISLLGSSSTTQSRHLSASSA